MKALEWTQHFPHYNSMVAMETSGRIWPNFELIQALIHVLITCKYEKNPIKNSGENVMTSFSPLFRSKMKALEWTQHFPHYNCMVAMETSGRIWPNFELIQALIHVLITCKYEKNPIKNSGENVMTSFSPL